MFTGIIQSLGTVQNIIDKNNTYIIKTKLDLNDCNVGSSICCDGVCLTVVNLQKNENSFEFEVNVSEETLKRTTIGDWESGTRINLETSLRLGDELHGHLVSGHIDGVGKLLSLHKDGGSTYLKIGVAPNLMTCIAEKGSICLDGVSLTVNLVSKEGFSVNIIPHTLNVTTLGVVKLGDDMNIEIDLVARYVARLMEDR